MPASPRSPQLTSAYRARLAAIRTRVEATARRDWPTIDGLDASRWPERAAQTVAGAQTEAVRATAGYLTAYVSSELGRRVRAVAIDSRTYAGLSRDGRPLAESMVSPLIAVRAALKDGKTPGDALNTGWVRAQRMLEMDLMHAGQRALLDAIDADDRLDGFQRVTRGTCGACMALSGKGGPDWARHPGCQCVPQPVVKGVPDLVPVPTGQQLLERMSQAEMVAQFGREKAEALSTGAIVLTDLVDESHIASGDDFITETPLSAAE